MVRFAATVLGVFTLALPAVAQQPVLVTGGVNGLLYGQVPQAVKPTEGPANPTYALTLGGLMLNSRDPLASAWLKVSTATGGPSTVAEAFPDGDFQQSFTLGGGNVLFGGNVPKEWLTALAGKVDESATPKTSAGAGGSGAGSSPVLSVEVTPPSEANAGTGDVRYTITTANGDDVLHSYNAPLETDGWWILGLSPTGSVITNTDGMPMEDGGGVKNPNPLPNERDPIQTAFPPPPVPEPGTLALAGLGLAAVGLRLRRK